MENCRKEPTTFPSVTVIGKTVGEGTDVGKEEMTAITYHDMEGSSMYLVSTTGTDTFYVVRFNAIYIHLGTRKGTM